MAPTEGLGSEKFSELKKIIETNPGASPVYLHLLYPDDREVVIALNGLKLAPTEEAISLIRELFGNSEVKLI
jgi:hypothetical protein